MALCSQESLSSNGRILSKAIAVEETLLSQSFYSKLFSKPFRLFVSERAVACVKSDIYFRITWNLMLFLLFKYMIVRHTATVESLV